MQKNTTSRHKNNMVNKICFFLLSLLIVINPLPLGSNRLWAWSLEAIFALMIFLILIVYSHISKKSMGFKKLRSMKVEFYLIGAWLLLNALYLIPLPLSLVSILSPNVAQAYADLDLSYAFLSLDVQASYHTLMLSFYYVLIFILGMVLINSRRRIKTVLGLFLVVGIFEAIYGMYLVSIEQTGTLIQVISVDAAHASGTFINKNHLVAFLSICFFMGLGLRFKMTQNNNSFDQENIGIKWVRFISHPNRLIDFGLFLIFAGIWSTHSRAGLASFILACLFLVALLVICKKLKMSTTLKSTSYKTYFLVLSVFVLTMVVLAEDLNYLLNSLGKNVTDSSQFLMDSAKGRLLAIQQVLENFHLYWLTGVGPGAYEVFFVNHRMTEQIAFFDHAHNDYFEFFIEYGLLSVLLLFIVFMFLYRIIVYIFKTPSVFYQNLGICTLSCVIYMFLHANMDFNARIPANIVSIMIAISVIYGKIVMLDVKKPFV